MKGPQGTSAYVAAWFPDRHSEAIFDVTIMWAAVSATGGSAGWAGVLVGLSAVPLLAATLVGGAYGDHRGAWWVSRVTLLARAGVFALLMVGLLAHAELVAIVAVVLAALGGPLIDGFHTPAMSSLAGLLGREGDEDAQGELQGAISGTNQLAKAIGAPLAGALVVFWAPGAMVLAVAGSLLSWAMFRALRPYLRPRAFADSKPKGGERKSLRAEAIRTINSLREAWGGAFRGQRPMQCRLVLLTLSNMVSVGPFLLAIPLKSDQLRWGWASYALVVGLYSVGAIGGGWVVNRSRRRIGDASLTVSIVVLFPSCAAMVIVAAAHVPWAVGVAMAAAGFCFAVSGALLMGDLNANAPEEFRGAMWSIVDVAIFGLIPLGQIAYGVLVEATSVRTAGLGFAAVATAALLFVSVYGWHGHDPALSSESRSSGSDGSASWSGTGPNQ